MMFLKRGGTHSADVLADVGEVLCRLRSHGLGWTAIVREVSPATIKGRPALVSGGYRALGVVKVDVRGAQDVNSSLSFATAWKLSSRLWRKKPATLLAIGSLGTGNGKHHAMLPREARS